MALPLRIAITGVDGRMGCALLEVAKHDREISVSAALAKPDSPLIGQTITHIQGADLMVTDSILPNQADVMIDFTRPEATLSYLSACVMHHMPMVIGTTGFSAEQKMMIMRAAKDIPIVFAPNMSVGVNVLLKLAAMATQILNHDNPAEYDVEIIEAHHKHKVDAPSGTALKLGEVVAQALGKDLSSCATYTRQGVTGERASSTIGFSTVRGGDIVGEHTVLFAGTGEQIELTHRASSRLTFAQGAIRAAKFLKGKPHGLFSMQDVLAIE